MTDKQIACAYLSNKLWGLCPDHDDLRSIAETELTEERCYKIIQRINEMCEKIRQPMIDHLNRAGIDTY